MYVSNTARYLGDSKVLAPKQFRGHAGTPEHCAHLWRAARCYHPQLTFAEFQHKFQKCATTLKCGDNRLPNGSVVAIDCVQPAPVALGHAYLGRFGTIPACQDPPTGLLIDCWNAATAKGLGYAGGQATLTRLSTAYQRLTRPNRLAGWVPKRGGGMRWQNPRRLGQPDILASDLIPQDVLDTGSWGTAPTSSGTITDATGATVPAPAWVVKTDIPDLPPPISIVNQPAPPPKIIANLQPTLPYVTAQTLIAAADLPGAPTVVKQAASQLPACMRSTSFLTGCAIAGIPNYVWLVVVFGGLLLAGGVSRRR